jgi:hypothetical protein
MSGGAVFILLSGDGKQDRLLMASGLLARRLRLVEQARMNDPFVNDPTPTLVDIERTHVLFMNARFKPFASVAFEYNTTGVASGNQNLSATGSTSQVVFSIQQFGDFFSDMGIYLKLKAPTITRTSDVNSAAQEDAPAARWCAYPGERIFSTVSFTVNGNALDSYTRECYSFHRLFHVNKDKEYGYNQLMGQENPLTGFYRQPGVNMSAATSDAATGNGGTGANPASHRVAASVYNGPQTPKTVLEDLELLIPVLFWFNKDVRTSIPSVSIPYGQRFLQVNLGSSSELAGLVPRGSGTWGSPNGSLTNVEVSDMQLYTNNLFVNPEVHDIIIRRIGFTLIRVHRIQQHSVQKSQDELQMTQFKWPVEHIMIGIKSTDQERSTRHLDAWHQFSSRTVTDFTVDESVGAGQSVALAGTAFNVSTLGVVSIPAGANVTNQLSPGDVVVVGGHVGTVLATTPLANTAGGPNFALSPPPTNAIVAASSAQVLERPVVEAEVNSSNLSSLEVSAHGIKLFKSFPRIFWNAYKPFVFGGLNIVTPNDPGVAIVNFCQYPQTYQPSGHVNISRAREFFLSWTTALTASNPGTAYFKAQAINFLLISDGSAVLRYST